VTCKVVNQPGGGAAIVCSRGRRPKQKCIACNAEAPLLCDWPVGDGKTCDAPICRRHAVHVGPDRDYCPEHARKSGQSEAA